MSVYQPVRRLYVDGVEKRVVSFSVSPIESGRDRGWDALVAETFEGTHLGGVGRAEVVQTRYAMLVHFRPRLGSIVAEWVYGRERMVDGTARLAPPMLPDERKEMP